jgi:hypothetical protein
MSSISINEIKLEYTIVIQLLSAALAFPPANTELFRVEVIHATRCRHTRPIRTGRLCWAGFSRRVVKIKIMSLGIVYNTLLFILNFKYCHFLSYPRTTDLCKHPVRFSLIDRRSFDG